MARPITQRIAELRKEIAEISARIHSEPSVPYQHRDALRQRQEERLKEIMEELRSLTQWKKP
jgi:chromosome segregation ATPase